MLLSTSSFLKIRENLNITETKVPVVYISCKNQLLFCMYVIICAECIDPIYFFLLLVITLLCHGRLKIIRSICGQAANSEACLACLLS